jgi:hypothetical protein
MDLVHLYFKNKKKVSDFSWVLAGSLLMILQSILSPKRREEKPSLKSTRQKTKKFIEKGIQDSGSQNGVS